MCNLMECIEKYEADNGIKINYSWKGKDEGDVNDLFSDWNRKLNSAIENNNLTELTDTINAILRWGGINRLKKERLKHYICKIQKISEGDEIDSQTLLSSWTKILAAYNPKKYFIYDSRVAIALKFLIREYDWFIPKRRNDTVGSYLRNNYQEKLTESQSYQKYLTLLFNVEECKRGICEKKLFMIGGTLTVDKF